MTAGNPRATMKPQANAIPSIPRRADWLIYAGIVFCVFTNALFGIFRTDADTVPYFDLSDAVKGHNWHSVVNAYWFPFYPALLTFARACFGYRAQYELMAARLLDALLALFFVA